MSCRFSERNIVMLNNTNSSLEEIKARIEECQTKLLQKYGDKVNSVQAEDYLNGELFVYHCRSEDLETTNIAQKSIKEAVVLSVLNNKYLNSHITFDTIVRNIEYGYQGDKPILIKLIRTEVDNSTLRWTILVDIIINRDCKDFTE